jgi:lipoprotein NlpI
MAVIAIVISMSAGGGSGDSVPVAAVPPTETPTPVVIPADTPEPTVNIDATVEAGIQQGLASRVTAVPVPTPDAFMQLIQEELRKQRETTTTTPYPTATPRPTYTPRPIPTARVIVVTPTPIPRPRPTATPNASSYYNKGEEYYEAENWVMAVGEFTNAIQVNPNYTNAYWYRGVAYKKLEQYQNATDDYTKAIQLDPNLAVLYSNRSATYQLLGQYQLAINDGTKAIQLDPNLANAYLNRGVAYHSQTPRQNQLAINDYTKAIQLGVSDYALAYENRGIAYRNLGQYTLANTDKAKACSLDSQYCSNNVVTPTPTPYPAPSMTQDCAYTLLIDQGFSSFAGKTIQFKIGSSWANETSVWVQGGAEILDLTSSTTMIPFGPYRAWPISLTVPSTRATFLSQSAPPHVVLGTANATPGTPITAWIDGNQVAAANCS